MTTATPLVSIVCTTYNHENYIRQALDGFIMQQCSFPIEVIVHDDASTDNTAAIIREYAQKYPDIIKPILQTENQYSKGYNIWEYLFTQVAKGKYIAICEGDDYWIHPLKLKIQVDFLEKNSDYGLIWTDVNFYMQTTGVLKEAVFKHDRLPIFDSFEETLINTPFFSPLTWVFRRNISPKGLKSYCDTTFPMILEILNISKIKYLNIVTGTYRWLDESASRSKDLFKTYSFINGIYEIQKDYSKKCNCNNLIVDKMNYKYYLTAYPYAIIFNDENVIRNGEYYLKKHKNNNCKVKILLLFSKFGIGKTFLSFTYNHYWFKKMLSIIVNRN